MAGVGLLFLAFVLHVLIWRLRIPNRQGRAILIVFAATLVVGIIAIAGLSVSEGDWWGRLMGQLMKSVNWITLYIICTLAYLISFTAIEADSPSLVMVEMIREAGERGIAPETLRNSIAKDNLVVPRISDLVRDKMVINKHDHLLLASKGKLLSQLFKYQRRLFRMGPGG
jgi:hypothetical protein